MAPMQNVDRANQLDHTQTQRIKKPFGGEQVRGLNVEEAGEAASGWVTLSSECILRSTLTHPCRRALGTILQMHETCQFCRFFENLKYCALNVLKRRKSKRDRHMALNTSAPKSLDA